MYPALSTQLTTPTSGPMVPTVFRVLSPTRFIALSHLTCSVPLHYPNSIIPCVSNMTSFPPPHLAFVSFNQPFLTDIVPGHLRLIHYSHNPALRSLAGREITGASKAVDRGFGVACAGLGGRRVRQGEEGYGFDEGFGSVWCGLARIVGSRWNSFVRKREASGLGHTR